MKVLHMSYAYVGSYDKPESWLDRISFFTGILERMARSMEVVAVYNIEYTGTLERNGVTYLFPGFKPKSLRWPFRFNNYILSINPDVIIIQGFSPWQTFLLGRKNSGLKILVQHRAEKPFKGVKKFLQKKADRYIHSYFFSSAALADPWIAGGQIKDKSNVIEVLGMSSAFKPIEKELALSRTGIAPGLVFLWVGDLNANKNPVLAIDAFTEFLKDHPSALLVMIYRPSGLEATLRLRTKGLEAHIRLVGSVPHENMIDWYNSADFVLSTSFYESAGLSVCEGMSCGCIPVLTDIPSFRMMSDGGRAGLLFTAGSKESLVATLKKCSSLDRAHARERALAWFKTKLSFDANVERIMKVADTLR
jgi:glycosyltransferase involved in cell wall biosynthesis